MNASGNLLYPEVGPLSLQVRLGESKPVTCNRGTSATQVGISPMIHVTRTQDLGIITSRQASDKLPQAAVESLRLVIERRVTSIRYHLHLSVFYESLVLVHYSG